MLTNYFTLVHTASPTFEYTKLEIMQILVHHGGFTSHQAHAVYHEHVAPMDFLQRVTFVSKLHTGVVRANNRLGLQLLATTRGL